MPSVRKIVLLAILFLLLLLPAAQMTFDFLPRKGVEGVHLPKKPPAMSWNSILDGAFQEKAEEYMMKRSGMWGSMVRLDNELNYRLFHQISSSYKTTAHAGRDGYFFQSFYLGSLNRTIVPAEETLDRITRNLQQLQALLAARGIPLVLLISTNAIALYPEIVPESFIDPTRRDWRNSYELMLPLLQKYGINYLDGHRYLQERKNSVAFRFFAPTASHWNDVATCLITKELMERVAKMSGRNFRSFTCDEIVYKDEPRRFDLDLLKICNLWSRKSTFQRTPYVRAKRVDNGEIYKPKMLFVGTSFLWSTLRYLDRFRITKADNFFFYWAKLRRRPPGSFGKIERAAVDWEKDILGYDALVLEINMAVVQNVGHGFIEDAIRHLGGTPLEVEIGNGLEQWIPAGG